MSTPDFSYEARLLDGSYWVPPVRLTLAQKRACRYSTRCGYKFGGEFGYENAVGIAQRVRRKRKQNKKWKP